VALVGVSLRLVSRLPLLVVLLVLVGRVLAPLGLLLLLDGTLGDSLKLPGLSGMAEVFPASCPAAAGLVLQLCTAPVVLAAPAWKECVLLLLLTLLRAEGVRAGPAGACAAACLPAPEGWQVVNMQRLGMSARVPVRHAGLAGAH
jgi:hypothetical protein